MSGGAIADIAVFLAAAFVCTVYGQDLVNLVWRAFQSRQARERDDVTPGAIEERPNLKDASEISRDNHY